MTSSASGGTRREPSEGGDPLIGKTLDGRYRIEAVLGTGGVGVVYRAVHLALGRPVAIKVLHDQLGLLDELRKRFQREAQVLSQLSHPHVVAINDYGIADNVPYLVMELLEGMTLADRIDDHGPPEPDVAIEIARQVLRGLAFAHARGIVHRDLKAANIFLVSLPDAPFHVKILDFGLAKIYAPADADEPLRDRTLTKSGTILGTPAYMSPEQASGSNVDERTDVYSAGVVLFELLTGRYPFKAPTRADMLRAHMLEPVPSIAATRPGLEVAPELDALVAKAMAKERPARFQDAQSMLDALDALPRPAAVWAPVGESGAVPKERVDSSEDPTVPLSSDGTHPSSRPPPPKTERLVGWRRHAMLGGGLALLAGAGVILAVVATGSDEAPRNEAAPAERAAEAPTVADAPPAPAETAEPSSPAEAAEGTEAEAPAADEAGARQEAPVDAGAAAEEVAQPELPPPVDPFEQVLPQPLRRYHLKVRTGRQLLRGERRALQQLQRRMGRDPRPTLVLAHHFVDINFLNDALERYELAFQLDPSSRGDARMLRDLVRLSGTRRFGDRAADMVVRIYGDEARGELDRQIGSTMDPEALDRLTLLRDRLTRP